MDETEQNTKIEYERLVEEIDNLVEYSPVSLGIVSLVDNVKVHHRPLISAIDGKVKNVARGNNWSQRCPDCWCTYEHFKDGQDSDVEEIEGTDEIALGPLHYLINTGTALFKAGTRNFQGARYYNTEVSAAIKKKVKER